MQEQTVKDIKNAIAQIEYHAAELNGFLSDDTIISEDEQEELEKLRNILGVEERVESALCAHGYTEVSDLIVYLEDKIAEREDEIDGLNDSIRDIEGDKEELEEQISNHEIYIDELKEKINDNVEEIDSLKDKIIELEKRLDSTSSTLNDTYTVK